MSYTVDTGKILDAIRDAAGASVVAGGVTYTWAHKLEGPAMRWLDLLADYPALTLEVVGTQVIGMGKRKEHITSVAVYAIVKLDLNPAALIYTQTRVMGEALLNALMSATTRIGNMRQLANYGVDTDIMGMEHYAEQGFGVYRIELEVLCFPEDSNP